MAKAKNRSLKRPIYTPSVRVFPSISDLNLLAAGHVKKVFLNNPSASCIIAAGNTLRGMFDVLIGIQKKKEADFSKATFIVLDEYWYKTPGHTISTATRTWKQFYSHIGVKKNQIISFDGTAKKIQTEIDRVKKEYKKFLPIDLAILGIGPGKTCHLGLNDPGSSVDSRIRAVEMSQESRLAMMKKLNLSDQEVPKIAMTFGIADLLETKEILLLAFGENKSWGVNRALNGSISSQAPGSFLRYHPHVQILLDQSAAALLP